MLFEAVLFDLDGTLIDTVDDIGDAVNRILSNNGFPTHPTSTYRNYIGDGSRTLIKRALPEKHRKDETIDTCLKAYIEHGINLRKGGYDYLIKNKQDEKI